MIALHHHNDTCRLRLHIREKTTGRTWLAFWPWLDGVALCMLTGHKSFERSGLVVEYSDRGERVIENAAQSEVA